MKKVKGDGGAMSTKDTGFKKGSAKGVPASTMQGKVSNVKGNTAKFAGGKKKVGK